MFLRFPWPDSAGSRVNPRRLPVAFENNKHRILVRESVADDSGSHGILVKLPIPKVIEEIVEREVWKLGKAD